MKKKFVLFLLAVLVCLSVVSTCTASLASVINFKMVCNDTELQIGEITTVYVQAWIDSAYGTAGNGLDTWQMDLSVDTSGVIGITDIVLIAPDPDPSWSGWNPSSVNNPVTGAVAEVSVVQTTIGNSSEIGIGGYSDIFSFQIEALAEGIATYDMSGVWFAFLADSTWFEDDQLADGGVYFDAAGSDNVFNVVPEPCSLLIMSGLSVLALRRKRLS